MPFRPRYNSSGTHEGDDYFPTPPLSPRAKRTTTCYTSICESLQEVKYEIDRYSDNNIHSVSVTDHKGQLLLVILYS
jgi:hypothetical protein